MRSNRWVIAVAGTIAMACLGMSPCGALDAVCNSLSDLNGAALSKRPLTQPRLGVDVLQSPQDLRNVVTRFRREVDRANVNAIKQHLRIDHVAHEFGDSKF